MKIFAIIALLLGSTLGSPAKLDDALVRSAGYIIAPPPEIPALYELPDTTTTTTTTTTTLPPPPPETYLPPAPTTPPPPPPTAPPTPPPDTYLPPPTQPPPEPKPMMLMPYEFTYGVDDAESGNRYAHAVKSDGEHVEGEYSVVLPDGRHQVVKFTSDPDTGYVAEVTYLK